MKKLLLLSSALVATLLVCPKANAVPIITSSVGGAPIGANHLNFDDLIVGSTNGTFATVGPSGSASVVITSDGGVVSGGSSGLYAPPYLSGSNGVGFGSQPVGPDATPYLTTGKTPVPGGSVRLDFSGAQLYFGILWGSIDLYNTLRFYNGATLVDTITGADILALANGDQGINGTRYVNILTTSAFTSVVATSSEYAFEFDNVAYSSSALTVPDGGATVALLGMALGSMAWVRRKVS